MMAVWARLFRGVHFSNALKLSAQRATFCTNNENSSGVGDKVAIVTGGASGIGYSIAKEFLKNGLSAVTIFDIDEEKGKVAAKEIATEFGDEKVLFVAGDVADSKQFDKAFKKTVNQFENVHIVVNNAGVMDDTRWDRQIKTNLCGSIIGTLLGMQYMSSSASGHGGTIVNIGSIMSMIPSSGYPLHTMTQFGIIGFTKALGGGNHVERTNVKIFAFCPGLTNTELLTNAPPKAINENFTKEYLEEIEGCEPQQAESVAKGLHEVIETAVAGSIWVVEKNNKPYLVNFPEIATSQMKEVV